jgi:hypothetical protein
MRSAAILPRSDTLRSSCAHHTLGWSEGELLGKPGYRLVHPDDVQKSDNERITRGVDAKGSAFGIAHCQKVLRYGFRLASIARLGRETAGGHAPII